MLINSYIASILKTINYTLIYTDFMTVYRKCEIELENGSIGYEKKKIYNKIPCRLSVVVPDKTNFVSIDINPLTTLMKVFCDTSLEIKKGDYITCLRIIDGQKRYYQGLSNEPIRYIDGHQELYIQDTAEGNSESFEGDISDKEENDNENEEEDVDDSFGGLFRY